MLEIITKINKTVEKYNMLSMGDKVVIGVSGGADSMLLLSYFIAIRDDMQIQLVVANVEHGIRGEASLSDSAFVKRYCERNNVEFKGFSINAPVEAKAAGMGVEEYSREKRYEFFRSLNADKIATAHNLSDNVETVLFRLSRGTSIKGCCGIPAVRGNIIRPIIELSSDEIRRACKDFDIPYVKDETNDDITYSRNYVRNRIVPLFNELNPSFENVFSRFICSVNDDEAFIESEADKCFDACFKNNSLRLDKLNKYNNALVKRAIIKYVSLYDITLDDLHLNGVYELTHKQGRYQIKNNCFAISDKNRLRLAVFDESYNFDELIINKRVTSRADFLTNCELYQKQFAFFCDYDKICGGICIRPREEGDEISPANRKCTKSLKKLYNEYKIPVEERDKLPLICDDNGIIGVYGYCIDERVKIDNTTNNVILLQIRMED